MWAVGSVNNNDCVFFVNPDLSDLHRTKVSQNPDSCLSNATIINIDVLTAYHNRVG